MTTLRPAGSERLTPVWICSATVVSAIVIVPSSLNTIVGAVVALVVLVDVVAGAVGANVGKIVAVIAGDGEERDLDW